jgi:hypothetical protein
MRVFWPRSWVGADSGSFRRLGPSRWDAGSTRPRDCRRHAQGRRPDPRGWTSGGSARAYRPVRGIRRLDRRKRAGRPEGRDQPGVHQPPVFVPAGRWTWPLPVRSSAVALPATSPVQALQNHSHRNCEPIAGEQAPTSDVALGASQFVAAPETGADWSHTRTRESLAQDQFLRPGVWGFEARSPDTQPATPGLPHPAGDHNPREERLPGCPLVSRRGRATRRDPRGTRRLKRGSLRS